MTWRGRDEALEIKTVDEFTAYLRSLDYQHGWRPSGMVLHNTASPTLDQWWHGGTSPEQRMENLQYYYEHDMGWSAGPHAFIDGESVWVMTDFNVSGVHSPSWNGTRLGIEMVGDYDIESDEVGMGAKVMEMTIALFGECHMFFGWEPSNTSIKCHYEDPASDHACPGSNVSKAEFVSDVTAYMGDAGDDQDQPMEPIAATVANVPSGDVLNVRSAPSSSSDVVAELHNGEVVMVNGEAWNGSTQWLHIIDPLGWASAAYVSLGSSAPGVPPPTGGYSTRLPQPFGELGIAALSELAEQSEIAVYLWEDRGQAPLAYIQGMAVSYAFCIRKWMKGDPAVREMARASTGNADLDALTWYADVFRGQGMKIDGDGIDTLRALFCMLMGLGMRESSGVHCEGRDQSADNVQADTAEAGLFQTSWNINSCSPEIMDMLMQQYVNGPPQCALEVFATGVECSATQWDSYGSGEGAVYQMLAKGCPEFAIETTGVGLRNRRQHWGPINRKEVEIRPEADAMFRDVEALLLATV